MSVSLENARLFQETKLLLAETERGKKNVELLSDIGKEITASLDFETFFINFMRHINQLADATILEWEFISLKKSADRIQICN